jgi:hypothetical protein
VADNRGMPRLATFYGIVIWMYRPDHPPPHFHAQYGEYVAQIEFSTLQVVNGSLLPRAACNGVHRHPGHAPRRCAERATKTPTGQPLLTDWLPVDECAVKSSHRRSSRRLWFGATRTRWWVKRSLARAVSRPTADHEHNRSAAAPRRRAL